MSTEFNLRQRKTTKEQPFPIVPTEISSKKPELVKIFVKPRFTNTAKEISLPIISLLFIAALFVRMYRIALPPEVVFDEVHFGGFSRKYILGIFFMDVHPPLGKLLFAAVASVFGFKGDFKFTSIGDSYLDVDVPFIQMRILPAFLSAILVPMGYITLRNFGRSQLASVVGAFMLLFENAITCQSRLILLDSSLTFFTGLTLMMWSDFLGYQLEPFSASWWLSLAMTGVGLGLSISVKWVGLFIIAAVGCSTLRNLWIILGDYRTSNREFTRHFVARALCLIGIPVAIYVGLFAVHFSILSKKGSGSAFMSSEFQSTLRGSDIPSTFRGIFQNFQSKSTDVSFGSKVRLKHVGTSGGYLHSHAHVYQTGSKQQQVTLYPHRDNNNWWRILPAFDSAKAHNVSNNIKNDQHNTNNDEHNINNDQHDSHNVTMQNIINEFRQIKHGDVIRLEHISTQKKLHSHSYKPPVTETDSHNEVSGYGGQGFPGDSNDNWRVEIPDRKTSEAHLNAISTKFHLVHVHSNRKLFSHKIKLPEWGNLFVDCLTEAYGQQEVTAASKGRNDLTLWRIEANEHVNLTDKSAKVQYKRPGFLGKFIELHKVMWKVNQGLTKAHPYQSRPLSWPLLSRGISYWTHKSGGATQIYLLGNPIVWWAVVGSICMYVVWLLLNQALNKRRVFFPLKSSIEAASNGGGFLLVCWMLHYFPFFLMNRQLFLHHYLPALYFGTLLVGVVFDMITLPFKNPIRFLVAGGFCMFVAWSFFQFSPLAYGTEMSFDECLSLKWSKEWKFDCNRRPKSIST